MDKTRSIDGNNSDRPEEVTKTASEWANFIRSNKDGHRHLHETGEEVPDAMEGTLAAVAASFIYSAAGMSRWGLAEATLGLYKLYCRHDREGVIDTINGTLVISVPELQEIAHWLNWANAAYEDQIKACARVLEIKDDCIINLVTSSSVGKPAYFVAVNHSKKAVVLSIRGTFSATDVLTDLKPHSEPFGDGYAHSGMLTSARWLRDNVSETLKELMTSHGYRLVVTGHSLGAGTASLLCMLLRETNENGLTVLGSKPEVVTCWGFCCPPCVDTKLAEEVPFIRNVIHQDDIVGRISPAAVEDLRTEVLQTDWTHALEDGSTQKKVVDVAQASKTLLDNIEPVLNYEKGELVKQVKEQAFTAMKGLSNSVLNWAKAKDYTYGAAVKQHAEKVSTGALSLGSQFALAAKKAIMEEMERIQNDNRSGAIVTASSMTANAHASNVKEGTEFLEKMRLYVPGILYHVIRRPLAPGEKLPDELPLGVGTSKGAEKDNSLEKHIVVRGDDPSSRFQRIVLSTSLISDHLLSGLQVAVADAMKWQHSGNRI